MQSELHTKIHLESTFESRKHAQDREQVIMHESVIGTSGSPTLRQGEVGLYGTGSYLKNPTPPGAAHATVLKYREATQTEWGKM